MPDMDGKLLIELLGQQQDSATYQREHWEGTLTEYLDVVRAHPEATRSAFQRVYDMILSYGTEEIYSGKEKLIHYRFFDDPDCDGSDAIFGLDRPLAALVNVLKSAAQRYGSERRGVFLRRPPRRPQTTTPP